MNCPKCNHDVPGDAHFCRHCGFNLSSDARFCNKSRTKVETSASTASGTPSGAELVTELMSLLPESIKEHLSKYEKLKPYLNGGGQGDRKEVKVSGKSISSPSRTHESQVKKDIDEFKANIAMKEDFDALKKKVQQISVRIKRLEANSDSNKLP